MLEPTRGNERKKVSPLGIKRTNDQATKRVEGRNEELAGRPVRGRCSQIGEDHDPKNDKMHPGGTRITSHPH
jgi:hypothetical protein